MDFHEGFGSPPAAHALASSGVNPQRRAVVHQHVVQVLVVGLGEGVLHGRHAAEAVGGDVAGFAAVQEDGDGHLGLPATEDGVLLVRVGDLVAKPGQQVTATLVEQGLGLLLGLRPVGTLRDALLQFVRGEQPLVSQAGDLGFLDFGQHGPEESGRRVAIGFGQCGAADAFHLPDVQVEEYRRHFACRAA